MDEATRCPTCGGSGDIQRSRWMNGALYMRRFKCSTCLDSGYVTVCGDCGGSGESYPSVDVRRAPARGVPSAMRCSGCGGSGVLPYPANNKDNKHNHK